MIANQKRAQNISGRQIVSAVGLICVFYTLIVFVLIWIGKIENEYFTKATNNCNPRVYLDKYYPNGRFVKEMTALMDSIENSPYGVLRSRYWNDLGQLNKHLIDFKYSKRSGIVKERINFLSEKYTYNTVRSNHWNDPNVLKKYLDDFPQAENRDVVQKRIEMLKVYGK